MQNLIERAILAYAQTGKQIPNTTPRPDYEKSGIYQYNRRDYVVLRTSAGTPLAVYRIRPSNGTLRRLLKYPAGLSAPPITNSSMYRKINEK